MLTFAGSFLGAVSDALDFGGLVGQALGDLLDSIDADVSQRYCCSKEEIENWKDCYWAVGRYGVASIMRFTNDASGERRSRHP